MILQANSLRMPLADNSVHMCVTSPPYWQQRSYLPDDNLLKPQELGNEELHDCLGWATGVSCGECFVCHMRLVFAEAWRVLRPDGTLWLNLADSYAGSGKASGSCWENGRIPPASQLQGGNQGSLIDGPTPTPGMLKHKDKAGIPGRVALALQADGWWWRSTIIWAKGVSFCDEYAGACMPESVKDRPTRAHEYLFLFSKSRYYFYDHDAVRERSRTAWNSAKGFSGNGKRGAATGYDGAANNQFNSTGTHEDEKKSGRNLRDVWTINPAGYPGAHFATFPPELVTPCVLAGTSQRGVCPECGAPWGRQTQRANKTTTELRKEVGWTGGKRGDELPPMRQNLDLDHSGRRLTENLRVVKTVGWESTCEHDLEPVPAIVLDPFAGSGTVGEVCRGTGRRFMGFDLYREYLETIALPRAENKQTQASIDSLPLFGGE